MEPLLKDKVAIITGAGRGIGAATARLFAQEGARLVLNDLDPEPLDQVIGQIRAEGGEARPVPGDVSDPKTTEALITGAIASWNKIDILVNNAGFTWDGMIHKMSDEQWETILAVHLTSAFRLIRAAAPYMRDAAKAELAADRPAQARKIVNVSSIVGTRGGFGQANYSAAKAGLLGLTRTLAREWGAFNIQVNAAAFSWIETRLTDVSDGTQTVKRGDKEIRLGVPKTVRDTGLQAVPLGRAGTPEEAAKVLLFLASHLSDFVSGHVLEVTGGE
jgi:3-oxoacyl-[acyl-carrier protein] reductase